MPVRLEWDNEEKTILRQTYEGTWSSAEIRQAVEDNYQMQASVNHPVDVIASFTASKPGAILISSLGSQAESRLPPNQRLVIVVGASALIRVFMRIARQFAPKTMANVYSVAKLAEAYTLIERMNPRASTPDT